MHYQILLYLKYHNNTVIYSDYFQSLINSNSVIDMQVVKARLEKYSECPEILFDVFQLELELENIDAALETREGDYGNGPGQNNT